MNLMATDNWHRANYIYLITAVAKVHQALKHQVSRKQNKPTEAVPDGELALKTAAAALPAPSVLEQLCTTFGLSPFERDLLLLCVGMELDPSLVSLCAEAQGNAQLAYPTFSLALAALPSPHLNAFKPLSPLRHWQLIEVGMGMALTQSPLRIDECILYYLAGEEYEDPRLNRLIKPLPPETDRLPLPPSHQALAKELATTWNGSTHSPTLPLIQLCGTEIASKQAIAATACATIGLNLQILSVRHLPADSDSLNHLIIRWQRQAILTNSALLIECDSLNSTDTARVNTITEFIENTNTPLIITTVERHSFLQRPLITFDVPSFGCS